LFVRLGSVKTKLILIQGLVSQHRKFELEPLNIGTFVAGL